MQLSTRLRLRTCRAILSALSALLCFAASAAAQAPAEPAEPEATYQVTFNATWNAASPHAHPEGVDGFPAGAHFSALIGAVHSADVQLWQPGESASPGIEQMAEEGRVAALEAEANSLDGTRQFLIGDGLPRTPGQVVLEDVLFTQAASRLTLVTMIAPSPDWFVGITGLDLFEDGVWLTTRTIDLHPYDAGTEEGTGYSTTNAPTDPQQPITRLSDHSFGTLTITRSDGLHPVLFMPVLRK